MHKLKEIKEELVEAVQCELSDIAHADTKELGDVIDMIKDIEAAMYYHAATTSIMEDCGEAMPAAKKHPKIADMDKIIKDMTEYAMIMAKDATPEQKTMLSSKIIAIANKIV